MNKKLFSNPVIILVNVIIFITCAFIPIDININVLLRIIMAVVIGFMMRDFFLERN